ncbi:hypothetical protein [Megasphaera massiliensis]|uniref:hypothetical protein n=2 Tax=Megasphaera massiliensis TaxID=1232428 RepID=UPI003AAB9F69
MNYKMASGGWFGYLPSSAKILLKRGQRNRNNGSSPVGERAETVQTSGGMAAPAPTVAERVEYDVSTARNVKKKRGKNSLYVSSSGTGSGGTGINL